MKTHGPMLLSFGVLTAALAAGCGCLSSEQVLAKTEYLQMQNRARAEPAMLAAANAHGAVLLSLEPQTIELRLPCVNGTDNAAPALTESQHEFCFLTRNEQPSCQQWASDGRTFLIRSEGERPKLAIPVRQADGSSYTRLARRDNKLFVLRPRLTSQEEVGRVTECECDGMPRVQCPSTFGFVLDEALASPEVEEIWVPMAEEHIRRICKTSAV